MSTMVYNNMGNFMIILLIAMNLGAALIIPDCELRILINNNIPESHQSMFYGIVLIESSGNPKAIGDDGESVGLTQLHANTITNLVKNEALSQYNGEKLTISMALKLRYSPKFNLYAANILAEHNKNILISNIKVHKLHIDNTQLMDLVIKSHNQGVQNTITRDLLGRKPSLKSVNIYLAKIRKIMKKWRK